MEYPKPTVTIPSVDDVLEMLARTVTGLDTSCETTDGCTTDPDGTCSHGHPSWLVRFGLI